MEKKHNGAIRHACSTSFTNSDVPKLFNGKCFLCKKGRIQRNNQERFPVTIATDEAVESFLAAAKAKDQLMYKELLLLDVYAKEFKWHEHCHRNFTRGFTKSGRNKQVIKPKVSSCVPLNTPVEKL